MEEIRKYLTWLLGATPTTTSPTLCIFKGLGKDVVKFILTLLKEEYPYIQAVEEQMGEDWGIKIVSNRMDLGTGI